MAERPLILFAAPIPVDKARRYGGGTKFYRPPHQKQVERLSPKFNSLIQAFNKGRIKIAQNPDGVKPEYTLVLEVAGDPHNFETAVRHINAETEGIEWLFEVVDNNIPNSDDFYCIKDNERNDAKTMTYKYFCILTNLRALGEILSLWQTFQSDEKCDFPHGQAGLKNVFKTLSDIHLWGIKERLEETGILEIWQEELSNPETIDVKCEIELFCRQSLEKRVHAQGCVAKYIQQIGGNIIATSCIEAIGYHAILASIPRQYAQRIVENKAVELVQLDQIMFLKPTGQSIVIGSADGLPFNKVFHEPENIIEEPVIALFDGLPQERHPLLNGILSIDDPDDFTAFYQIDDRQHGTSMASLIARGDLAYPMEILPTHKIYVRPIMKPYPQMHGTQEYIPDNILIVDKIHEAVRRLYEHEVGQVATSVRVINMSIGYSGSVVKTNISKKQVNQIFPYF